MAIGIIFVQASRRGNDKLSNIFNLKIAPGEIDGIWYRGEKVDTQQ